MSKRWQYKIVEVKTPFLGLKPAHVEEQLAQLGSQGWELTFVAQRGLVTWLYLKKEH